MELNMSYLLQIILFAHLFLVCLGQTKIEHETSLRVVEQFCAHKLQQINSIKEFEHFMEHYNAVVEAGTKPQRRLLSFDNRLQSCLEAKNQLLALEELVRSRKQGVCKMEFINKLVDYHVNYMLGDTKTPQPQVVSSAQIDAASKATRLRWSFDAHFFSLFAHQVALTCKSKISERLEEAQTKFDCSQVISMFLPPSDEQEALENAETQMNQFQRVEDFVPLLRQTETDEPYFDLTISPQAMVRLEKLKNLCREREPYYKFIFTPVALLAQLGYKIDDTMAAGSEEKITRCWLTTAQLCQGILRTHLNVVPNFDERALEDDDTKFLRVVFGKLPADVSQLGDQSSVGECHVDSVEEFSPQVIELVKKKGSLGGRLKHGMLVWARNFLENHMDIETRRRKRIAPFVESLTRDSNSVLDAPVAFNGRKTDSGKFLPARLITDDADTIIQAGSFFTQKAQAVAFNSVVGLALAGEMIYFASYAALASCRRRFMPDVGGNFKAEMRELHEKRVQKLKDKKNGWKQKMMVYKAP